MYRTDMYEGMLAETVSLRGAGGDLINAYSGAAAGPGPVPRHGAHPPPARLG